MNKFCLAAAFCAATLILFSCSQEEDVSREETPSKEKEWKEVIITASLDEATQPDTRTSLVTEGGAIKEVLWSPGDSVKLFSLGEDAAFVSINTTPTRVARFKGMIPFITGADENGEVSYIYGLYPYRADATYSETEPGVSSTAVITTTLPNVQTGKAGTFDDGYAVTLGRSESLSVPFRTVYTLLRFSLTRDDITSVSFKGNNGEAIAGRFKVGMESKTSTVPEVKGFVSPETEITMKMEDGSAFEAGQFYYFVMLPTTFSDGFTLSLTRSDGRSGDFVIDGKSLTLSRNKFSSISDLDTRVAEWKIDWSTDPDIQDDLLTPLCLEAVEDGTITISNPLGLTIEYIKGKTDWTPVSDTTIEIPVSAGEKVYFRGNNASYSTGEEEYTNISCSAKAYVYGNIMSLINHDDFESLTTLTGYRAFGNLFYNNTNLFNHPERSIKLPATKLTHWCYRNLFRGCTNITRSPELPATDLSIAGPYKFMFFDCTSLTEPPVLPATTVASNAYFGMFRGCSNLETAPALPATTLGQECYREMFAYCTSLTSAPVLPATTMHASQCYDSMFFGCTSLQTAPDLPAMELSSLCYRSMFFGCKSLTKAQDILPATELEPSCYSNMFQGCSNLQSAPELPAQTLADNCYYNMFNGCSKLNYIKMLAKDISAENAMANWVNGVASTGTFVKDFDATWDVVGNSGVPTGWVLEKVLTRDPIYVTGITLNKNTLSLLIGSTETLSATIAPDNADDKSVSWSSSNSSIASVDANGKVTAKAVGTATITVTTTDGGKTASCSVSVSPIAVTGITLNKTTLSLTKGSNETLTATVSPSNATNPAVTWTSSNTSVATVSNGTVTAVGKGTATITAKAGDKTETCSVTVTVPVSGVSLDKTSVTLTKGSTQTLVATVTPSDASNTNVSWKSSNTSVATVDANGKITAVAKGSATITVTTADGSKTANCTVSVIVPVTGVSLDKTTMTLSGVNSTGTLTATITPSDASNTNVTWSSSNTSVATVSNGTVTAKGAGTATITVTTADGGKKATCVVMVNMSSGDREGYVKTEESGWED